MKNIIFSALLLVFMHGNLQAQGFSDREFTVKTFPVNPQTSIEVNNKYGDVHVLTWKKDSVKFIIDLKINSSSRERLQKLKAEIRFDFTSSKYYVTANSNFGGTGNQIFAELRSLSESLIPGKNSIEVNYTIYCPESVNLSINNKFGDLYIDDLRGEINLNLSNGDMKINSLNGESNIELYFGNAIINHLTDSKITLSYAELKLKQAEKLQTITKSSTIHIEEVDLLKIESRRDKYFLADVYNMQGNSDFSQIWLEKINCDLDMNLKFGDLRIDYIPANFCKLDIVSDYADLNIYIAKNAVYKADFYYKPEAFISFPGNVAETSLTTINQSTGEPIHSFYSTGNGENLPSIKVQAIEKCFINVINK
ncbi:MAG: hypothetical protein K9H49_07285 [Bacteroidales bacterium]|nr:hypothetical protein [Bacteroidales bacterium]MCF8390315.1 hypothetical protein [Bacteroidales bacterium]